MSTWLNLLAVAAGGAIGSLCRYGVTLAAALLPGGSTMLGTTVANLLGCVFLGGLMALGSLESATGERLLLALRVGFLGSLTTFSTFTAESSVLANQGRWGATTGYVLANLVLGWIGFGAAMQIVKGWTQA